MPRQRMTPGEWGKITVKANGNNKFRASAYVRDGDGRRREVEAIGGSVEQYIDQSDISIAI
jgi:hypothetical protein